MKLKNVDLLNDIISAQNHYFTYMYCLCTSMHCSCTYTYCRCSYMYRHFTL